MNRLFVFSLILALASCQNRESRKDAALSPQQLLLEIYESQSFASVEEVADWMINRDPTLILVDVRQPADFQKFSLPGAINIPLDQILGAETLKKLDCSKYMPVFFSNDDILAEQAWILHRRAGCTNSYVMKGGLNEWMASILQPQEPPQTASAEEFELYRFRQALGKYFTGGSKALETETFTAPVAEQAPAPKKIQVKPKPKVEEEEEGC